MLLPWPPPFVERVKMVRIQYLSTTAVDFRSETCLVVVSILPNKNRMTNRPEFAHDHQQILRPHHLHPTPGPAPLEAKMMETWSLLVTILTDFTSKT